MQQKLLNSVKIFYPKFNKEDIINNIKKAIPLLKDKLSIKLVVLFGSYAKGRYTVASDIDLLIIYEGKAKYDPFIISKKIINIKGIEPHIYSQDEYLKMKNTLDKIIKEGIIIYEKN